MNNWLTQILEMWLNLVFWLNFIISNSLDNSKQFRIISQLAYKQTEASMMLGFLLIIID